MNKMVLIAVFSLLSLFNQAFGAQTVSAVLKIEAGPHFKQSGKIGPLKITTTPQMVLWVESKDGSYKKTIWMTRKFAAQEWAGQRYDADKVFRESTFTRWLRQFPGEWPSRNRPLPDSVTGASPQGDHSVSLSIPAGQPLVIYLEVNNAFDENKSFPNGSIMDGQPGVVYTAEWDGKKGANLELRLQFWSSPEGVLKKDLHSLTTAKNILKKVQLLIP